jgi:transposase
VSLTGGNRNDITQLIPLVDAISPIRGRRGRPRRRPRELFADRGYDHDIYRRQLRQRGITPRIARRGVAHGSGLGRQRWVVERTFAWLHGFKRLRTRYEHRGDIHLGLLQLACALICYRQLPVVLKRVVTTSCMVSGGQSLTCPGGLGYRAVPAGSALSWRWSWSGRGARS